MKRIHLFISGEVQGVTYRYRSSKKARELGLKGFVKNLYDGRVELIAEGNNKQVNEFLDFCKHDPGYSHVAKIELKEEKIIDSCSFTDFDVRF